MSRLTILSPAEQVATHLRSELQQRVWRELMPGTPRLSRELGVDPKTVLAALNLLEKEGYLAAAEPGKRRRIQQRHSKYAGRPIRIAILDYEPLVKTEGYKLELVRSLEAAGYTPFFAVKCLLQLRMNVQGVARLVNQTEADAWIAVAASREILQWFQGKGIPVFALFGRRRELLIAGVGPHKVEAYRAVVRRLVELGHRSMVLIAHQARRLPNPGAPERAFLDEMANQRLAVSSYNLPDWDESSEGLQQLLIELFRFTPPTALLVDEAYLFHAVKYHLSQRGLEAPRDVSLVCTDPDRTFEWCRPSIAHIHWDPMAMSRYILRWATNVARGKDDRRQNYTKAEFVEGGTIGAVPKKKP